MNENINITKGLLINNSNRSNDSSFKKEDNNGLVTSYLEKDNMYYNASFKVDSRTFRAEQYGKYTMRFVAYDSDFCRTVKEYTFEVR